MIANYTSRFFAGWVGSLFVLLPLVACAHAVDQSYVFLTLGEQRVEGRFEITVADLNQAMNLGLPIDQSVDQATVETLAGDIQDFYASQVRLAPDGRDASITFGSIGLNSIPIGQYIQLPFSLESVAEDPEYIDVEYNVLLDGGSQHRGLLVVETDWRTSDFKNEANVLLTFSPISKRQRLDLTNASMFAGFMGMVELGMHHILIGIDHILFLVALLIPSVASRDGRQWSAVSGFKPAFFHMVKVVTIFTVAHSVTLSLAALNVISLPSRLVESVIALSIAIAALDIVIPIFRQRIGWVVFAFDLFHGMGFASALGDIGIPASYIPVSLLAFNVGVELGQLLVVALVFPVLFSVRNLPLYPQYAMPTGAIALIVISGYWFTERAFEIDLPAGAIFSTVVGLLS